MDFVKVQRLDGERVPDAELCDRNNPSRFNANAAANGPPLNAAFRVKVGIEFSDLCFRIYPTRTEAAGFKVVRARAPSGSPPSGSTQLRLQELLLHRISALDGEDRT